MVKPIDINIFRSSDWWGYKLPPLFGFAYLIIELHNIPFHESWKVLTLLFFWMISAAGFGYYSNDVFDVEEDRIVGKDNSASSHSWLMRFMVLAGLSAVTLLPWILTQKPFVLILVICHLLLFLFYSVPPFRIKQKGVFGVVVDAIYAHLLPAVIVIAAIWPDSEPFSPNNLFLGSALLVWQAVLGVRGIIEHQIIDFELDKKAVSTNFAQRIGLKKALHYAEITMPQLEGFALVIFLSTLLWFAPLVAGSVFLVLLSMYMFKPFGEGVLKYRPNYRAIVNRWLNQIQEMVLPLIFLTVICLQDTLYLIVALIHIVMFLPGHIDHLAKPLYYKGVLGAYYTGKSGANVSFQTLIKVYARAVRPVYFGLKKLILWVYYSVLCNLYRFLKWFFYNVPYRFASWVWHVIYYFKNGQWHPEFSRKQTK